MKITEEVAKELLDDIGEYLNIQDHINEPEIEFVAKYFKDFETKIRKDQDKTTRHACVESVLKIHPHALNGVGAVLDVSDVEKCIINTDAVKK